MHGLLLLAFLACKKTPPAKIELTPLQSLVNTDSTLTLYHRMILRGNDAGLLNDAPATLFFPRNAVLFQSGYTALIIDSMSSALADRIVRYNYLPAAINADTAVYTANPTLLGIPLYVLEGSNGQLLLNGSIPAVNPPAKVGQASVYYLDSLVPPAADSLPLLLQNDSTLTYMNEVLFRTNLYDSLLLTGSYTLLAPTNTAFQQAGWDSLGAIDSANVDTLLNLAMNQVVKGAYFSNTFPATVMTLRGAGITVTTVNGLLRFAGAGNSVPVNWLSGNQVAGPTLILHHTDGILKP
ncbi:MAG TPA: fasciclin domain-containing protein [Puia sp.]|nr:fasciclin domain-containing protein [Puia sp.]